MIQSYLHNLRQFNRNVRLCLAATAVVGFTVQGGIYTVLLNLYLLRRGYGPEVIGLVNAMSPLAVVLCSFPASAVGARWGNRMGMAIGLVLAVAGSAALPMAELLPPTLEIAAILISFFIVGAGLALYMVNITPFLMNAAALQHRTHAFSTRVTVLPLAGFAGSLTGGVLPGLLAPGLGATLDQSAPYRYPLLVAACLLVPAIFTLLAASNPHPEEASEASENDPSASDASDKGSGPTGVRAVRENAPSIRRSIGPEIRLIALVAFIGFLRVMGEGTPRSFINVYLDMGLDVPTARIGVLIGLARLLAVPAGLAMPLIAARWGVGRTVVFGALGVAISLLPLALIPHWLAASLAFMAMTALAAVARSAFMVFAMEAVPPRWRGAMSGATTMSASVSWGATAYGAGALLSTIGYRGVFLFGAVSTVAGATLFWIRFCRGSCDRIPT